MPAASAAKGDKERYKKKKRARNSLLMRRSKPLFCDYMPLAAPLNGTPFTCISCVCAFTSTYTYIHLYQCISILAHANTSAMWHQVCFSARWFGQQIELINLLDAILQCIDKSVRAATRRYTYAGCL